MNPQLAKELNISEHERVKIVSQNGVTSELNVVYSDTVKKEHLYAPMHYIETNSLTPSLYDPYSKEPSYKTVAVVHVRHPTHFDLSILILFIFRTNKQIMKCDHCKHAGSPQCVEKCPMGAITFEEVNK